MTPEERIAGRRSSQARYRASHKEQIKRYAAVHNRRAYAANPEKEKARTSAYRKKHSEEVLAYARRRQTETPEKNRETCRKWYASHKAYCTERRRKYDKAHPERLRNAARKRRAIKHGAIGAYTQKELDTLMLQQGSKCADCGRRFTKRLAATLDHVLPLTRGGTEFIENLRWACKSCNSKKYNKHPDEWARINGQLFC